MDDFLHNLRSGKLKQGDRSNRSYNDPQYKGGPRRNTNDRRKGHYDNKESFERLNAIKEVLENLAESQKRMSEAYKARTRAEERKAKALEIIAKSIYQMVNPNANDADELFAETALTAFEITPDMITDEAKLFSAASEADIEKAFDDDSDDDESDDTDEEEKDLQDGSGSGRLTDIDRQALHSIIQQMRDNGDGWEKIARHIASKGYPTASGKGNWRGVMVKNLFEKMNE